MDLDWLRANPRNLGISLHHQRIRETPVPGGDVCAAARLTLDDGSELFVKRRAEAPEDFFAAEAAGLRWLTVPGGPPVPEVIAVDAGAIALQWIEHGEPTPGIAEEFGRRLATLHRAPCAGFGAPWRGYIATEPLDNAPPGADVAWLEWYRSRRIEPYLRASRDAGALTDSDVAAVEAALARVDQPIEPPARLHGDLHPGNVVWGVDRAWLVDPAAHGGHRETDLATLRLFGGGRQLDRILAAYQEVYPLAAGWQDRIGVHQLHLALVHTTLFGSGFAGLVRAAARA